ncbi:MAG: hypothetical protein N2Z58_09510 [Fervidobacterium sp.]|nr:hypothetical protein [Fervidobacterium sp.]
MEIKTCIKRTEFKKAIQFTKGMEHGWYLYYTTDEDESFKTFSSKEDMEKFKNELIKKYDYVEFEEPIPYVELKNSVLEQISEGDFIIVDKNMNYLQVVPKEEFEREYILVIGGKYNDKEIASASH